MDPADPVAHGVDPVRRVVLPGSGAPHGLQDRLGLTIPDRALPTMTEVGVLLGCAILMLALAVSTFNVRD